ncbi:MAG: class I SAM-dependent methyltransferase [Planctomycetia bacterium]|nr:class I SAM-dependent methyltransferase [Planctomycetia bacterium]
MNLVSETNEIDIEDIGCPACGSGDGVVVRDDLVDVEDRIQGRYAISRCKECSLVFLSLRPTSEALPRCYLPQYHVQDAARQGMLSRTLYGIRAHVRRRRMLAATRGQLQSLLEVGCGDASFLRHLDEHCPPNVSLVGIDLQAPDIREGRLQVGRGERETLIIENQFDTVVLFNVLEHLRNPGDSLRRINSLMTPAGILFGEVPNWDSVWRKLFPHHWQGLQIPRHMTFFTPTTLRHTLEAAGFEVVRFRGSFDPGDLAVTLCNWITDRLRLATPPRKAWFYLPVVLCTTPAAWLVRLVTGKSGCIEFTAMRRTERDQTT